MQKQSKNKQNYAPRGCVILSEYHGRNPNFIKGSWKEMKILSKYRGPEKANFVKRSRENDKFC